MSQIKNKYDTAADAIDAIKAHELCAEVYQSETDGHVLIEAGNLLYAVGWSGRVYVAEPTFFDPNPEEVRNG